MAAANELFIRYAEGDEEAFEEIFHANIRLVYMVAKEPRNLPYEDRIQEGCIGLIYAIRGFDVEMGFKFSTYAVRVIKQHIIRAARSSGAIIRLPENAHTLKMMLDQAHTEYENDAAAARAAVMRRAPKYVSMELIEYIDSSLPFAGSLEQPVFDDGAVTIGDQIASADADAGLEDAGSTDAGLEPVRNAVRTALNEQERKIIEIRYFSDEYPSLRTVAAIVGLSHQRIAQIEKSALKKLRLNLSKGASSG